MNSWCESCARKNQCYTADIRPKCYVSLTSNDRTADRKTEPQTCEDCKHYDEKVEAIACERCLDGKYSRYEPKDEPQTERVETMSCQECKWWFTDSLKHGGYCQSLLYNHECRYEPEVDCHRCIHFTTDKCQKCFGKELFIDSGYITKLTEPHKEREGE